MRTGVDVAAAMLAVEQDDEEDCEENDERDTKAEGESDVEGGMVSGVITGGQYGREAGHDGLVSRGRECRRRCPCVGGGFICCGRPDHECVVVVR